ncbi:MAG: serine/threonine protein kinase [Fimbriiglobus sp.]|nr:serine/threonine protein kinase [Fimbriiglobus sp.]
MGFFSNLFGSSSKRKVVDAKKRWDLQSRAGQGSMSKVWKAFDRDLGRTVAIKFNDKVKTAKFEEKFKLQGLKKPPEGEICVGLRHDNIVKTFEHGVTTDGEPYLVMEWVEGLGLNFLIDSRHQQLNGNRVNFVGQLCDALQFLHDSKYLHRDLCPRNVMVTTDGVVKLIDFGLTIPYTPQFCQPGNRTGTVDYLAPEVIKRSSTDHRVDLFALGCTAFEMFTGQLPWEKSLNSDETVRRRLNSPPRQAKVLKPDMTDELSAILMKSIDIDRNGRYKTATEFKEALAGMSKTDY